MKKWIVWIWLPVAAIVLLSALTSATQAQNGGLPADNNAIVTGFTTRFAGDNVFQTAVKIAKAVFPSTRAANQPHAIILVRADRKEELMTAVSVIHHPIDAPILFVEENRLPDETRTALEWFDPQGVAYDSNVQIIAVGEISDTVIQAVKDLGLRVRHIRSDSGDIADLAAVVDDYRATIHADHPDVVVVGSLDDPDFAIPMLSFNAHMPAGFAWVNRDSIPEATRGLLTRRFGPTYIYLMGPESAISEEIANELSRYGHVQRLSAPDPYTLSAKIAGFRDSGQNFGYFIGSTPRDFGWGIAEPGHNFTFINPDDWAAGLAAAVFSHRGRHGPILLVQADAIPDAVRRYLDEVVRPQLSSPRDQLFDHGTIIGNTDVISVQVQGAIDALLQPRPIAAEGDQNGS